MSDEFAGMVVMAVRPARGGHWVKYTVGGDRDDVTFKTLFLKTTFRQNHSLRVVMGWLCHPITTLSE